MMQAEVSFELTDLVLKSAAWIALKRKVLREGVIVLVGVMVSIGLIFLNPRSPLLLLSIALWVALILTWVSGYRSVTHGLKRYLDQQGSRRIVFEFDEEGVRVTRGETSTVYRRWNEFKGLWCEGEIWLLFLPGGRYYILRTGEITDEVGQFVKEKLISAGRWVKERR